MRVLIAAVLLAAVSITPAFADACKTLEQQTQAFSDADQRGDGAAMAKALDPDVVFFNETGERATRADMAGVTPTAGTAPRIIKTTDWDCKLHGDVAVASFIDVLEPGMAGEMKFRSVETWKKAERGWTMIGSETLTLPQDPDAIALDAKTLDEYAGTYKSASGTTFAFRRDGDALMGSVNGGPQSEQKAQARDIVFTPGHGNTPKVFQRGHDGKVTGFVYLRGKNSISFARVG
jgi:ketosteroid isomerase-like protein